MTREEVKNIVRHVFHFCEENEENCNWTDMNEACGEIIKALEQEPKAGHWILRNSFLVPYKCSECNCESDSYDDYCSHCGADMRGEKHGRYDT